MSNLMWNSVIQLLFVVFGVFEIVRIDFNCALTKDCCGANARPAAHLREYQGEHRNILAGFLSSNLNTPGTFGLESRLDLRRNFNVSFHIVVT